MLRKFSCLVAAVLIVAGGLHGASAQTKHPAPAATPSAPAATAAPAAKPSRIRLTAEKLKKMRAKWIANRPKLRACRKEVRAKGLVGDNRWFYIEDCMERT
jgi:hypothetical protein